jgi:starch phosphorylase
MANVAIVGSHSTNGVAAIHSALLRSTTVKDLAEMFPSASATRPTGHPATLDVAGEPALAGLITEAIGDGWMTDLGQLARLRALADDKDFRNGVRTAKRAPRSPSRSGSIDLGQTVDPDTIFDSQIKRIHEYKRQLLNALRIVVLYNRLRENPTLEMTPRTFLFAGKAAPAYHLAKLIIKFLNNLAETIDAIRSRGSLKVLFLPEYNVSLAER